MLTAMLAQEIDVDRQRIHRGPAQGPRRRRSVREPLGWLLVSIGLRLARPQRGTGSYRSTGDISRRETRLGTV